MHFVIALRRSVLTSLCLGLLACGPAAAAERAYELVSPAGGTDRVFLSAAALRPATSDGNQVCFVAPQAVSEQIPDGHCANRTSSGWQTMWVTQPSLGIPPDDQYGPKIRFTSGDGGRHVFASYRQTLPQVPTKAGLILNGFLRQGSETQWVTGPTGTDSAGGVNYGDRLLGAASADLTHVVFQTADRVLPADTNAVNDVYEWVAGTTRLVSRDADGNAVGGTLPGVTSTTTALDGVMSRDGGSVFFESTSALTADAEAGHGNVYRRQGDSILLVSPRRNPADPPPADITFVGAASDGATVYISTEEQLTADAKQPGPAIYRYDVAGDALTLIATGSSIAPLAVSADGSSLFYRATLGLPQLFVYRGGAPTMIGALFPTDTAFPYHVGSGTQMQRGLRVTSDGSVAVFVSQSPALSPGSPAGLPQVYRWEAGSGVTRLSTSTTASTPLVATIGNFATPFPIFPNRFRGEVPAMGDGMGLYGRAMSTDGGVVFFDSAEQLVAEDTNTFNDVYEWRDGAVRLVSTGRSQSDSFYLDNSADGSTVFFLTDEALVGQDDNAVRDVYAARAGGGFPEPPRSGIGAGAPAVGPGTVGGGSSPSTTSTHEVIIPPPDRQAGPGRVDPEADDDARVTVSRSAKVGRGRITIPLRLSGPGHVRVSVALGGRRLASGRRTVRAAGSKSVRVRLSKTARRQIRQSGNRRLTVTAVFSPKSGADVRTRVKVAIRGGAAGGRHTPRASEVR